MDYYKIANAIEIKTTKQMLRRADIFKKIKKVDLSGEAFASSFLSM